VYEPFGLVNLEAMACEAAVVASAVGGVPEIVVDGETGFLVPCDPQAVASDAAAARRFQDALASRINQLVDDPDLSARLGAAGRRRVLEHFTWPRVAERTVEVYRQVLAAPRPRP
jgi:starch synthase